jgi:hypothetical protein
MKDQVSVDLATVSVLLKTGENAAPGTPSEKAEKDNSRVQPPAATPKPKARFVPASRWIRFQLWFNTYRYALMLCPQLVSHQAGCSKFFTFIVLLQLSGMIVAGLGHFPYAHSNTGGIVIGNILAGVIVRNELFGRLLYLIVNTFFAKVSRVSVSYRV